MRHLLYYVCPIAGNGVWQWNVGQLLKRIELFDGKLIVAIATGDITHPNHRPLDLPGAVREAFAGHDCEFIEFANHTKPGIDGKPLGEVVAWPTLWGRIVTEPGVTFYAHAKGVTRPRHSPAHRWTEIMYETMLDRWPLVRSALATHPVACSFKKLGFCFPGVPSSWHPTGTFAWVRNSEMAARKWNSVPQIWAGTEAVWGVLFRPDEAACIFHAAHGTVLNCYNLDYMTRVVEPEYKRWKERHGNDRVQDDERVPGEAVPA